MGEPWIPSVKIPGTNLRTPTEFDVGKELAEKTVQALQLKAEAERKAAELQQSLEKAKNELVEDWSSGPPPGYLISGNTGVGKAVPTYAVDSGTLSKTGLHRNNLSGNLAIDMRGDPRLEEIIALAKTLPEKYAHLRGQEREKAITDELMAKVYEKYGSYSDETLKNNENKAEHDAKGVLWDSKAKLKDMPHGSLVCRHYAVVVSVALEAGGVHNHVVVSMQGGAVFKDGQWKLDPNDKPGYHAYVVTEKGAIVEGTIAGIRDDEGKLKSAYKPIINGVSVEDIVYRGHAALTAKGDLYGGHPGNGDGTEEGVVKAQGYSLARYNDQREQERARQQAEARERVEAAAKERVEADAKAIRLYENLDAQQVPLNILDSRDDRFDRDAKAKAEAEKMKKKQPQAMMNGKPVENALALAVQEAMKLSHSAMNSVGAHEHNAVAAHEQVATIQVPPMSSTTVSKETLLPKDQENSVT